MEMLQAELTELFFDQMAHVKMLVAKLTYQGELFLEQLTQLEMFLSKLA